MDLAKAGNIHLRCQPNALMTLKEYLMDYASPLTRDVGEALLRREVEEIPHERLREITRKNLTGIEAGERDFRV